MLLSRPAITIAATTKESPLAILEWKRTEAGLWNGGSTEHFGCLRGLRPLPLVNFARYKYIDVEPQSVPISSSRSSIRVARCGLSSYDFL